MSWTVDFCHCSGICCCILLCPWYSCIQYGKNVERLETGSSGCSCCDCCLYWMCSVLCITQCVFAPSTRKRITNKYAIDEDGCFCDCCYDCCLCSCLKHTFFPCCALSQEAHQLEHGQVRSFRAAHTKASGKNETSRQWA